MAASQSRTVHSKTNRVCPIHTRNIGPISPLSSTIPSLWIESLPKGRSDMPCMIQGATVPGIWLRPNHIWYIPRPTGHVLSTQEILDPSVHYPVLYQHLESSPYPKGRSHMPCMIQRATVPEKVAASQSRTVHSKTHRVCPIHTRNIGPIGLLSSTIPSPWIESLPKGMSDMPCMIQGATVPGKWLCPNHVRYIPRPTGSVLSTQEILDPSVHYPVLYHHLERSPYAKGRSDMPCMIQRATVPEKWLRPNHVRYITRPTESVLSTHVLDPSVHYPVLYHRLELSPYPKADLICHAWFKELLYQGNGCVPITYSTFEDPQGLSYPHNNYWTHRSIIQYYTIALNLVLTQRQVWYAVHDSRSYCTRKTASSQSRTLHSRPTGSVLSTQEQLDPSVHYPVLYHHLESSPYPKGRSHLQCMIQRATVPGKWLRPNYERYIPRPTGFVLSIQEILDPLVHYPVLYHHFESSPYTNAGLICHAWFKELLYLKNGCVPITYGTFQDPQGLSYPHKKYWTHWSNSQYYTITLNRVLTQRQVWYAMHDSKSYCARIMAASQSRTVHSKTHRVFPIHTRTIGLIGPLSSTIPPPWIES